MPNSDHIRAALERTVNAGTARIVYTVDTDWSLPNRPVSQDQDGIRPVLARGVLLVGKALGKTLLRLIARGLDFRHMEGDGVLDLSRRRSMVDFGTYAQLQACGQEWMGRCGQPLDTISPDSAHVGSPLWLMDLLGGVTAAGEPDVQELPALRHFSATINLADASAAAPDGMPSPAQDRFETLNQLRAEVWLDESHVRRIRFVDGRRAYTLALSDFGIDLYHVDWSRLPSSEASKETGSGACGGRRE